MSEPKKPCDHPKYEKDVKVTILDLKDYGVKQLVVKLRLKCTSCGRPFLFEGPNGFSTNNPTVSPDMTELVAPVHWPLRDEESDEEVSVQ